MSHFIIKLPTKPYLKKYLESQYGSPINFTTNDYFGTCMAGMLENPIRDHRNSDEKKIKFDKLDAELHIRAPKWWLQKCEFAHSIPLKNALAVNKLFEARFEEDLFKYSGLLSMFGMETKDALLDFCQANNIEIDVDITWEALKKKEYRFRKIKEKNTAQLSRERTRNLLKNYLLGRLSEAI